MIPAGLRAKTPPRAGGRDCVERRDLTIDDVRDVAEAFARLRDDGEGAAAALRRLSR
jgi:hypothetical protein